MLTEKTAWPPGRFLLNGVSKVVENSIPYGEIL